MARRSYKYWKTDGRTMVVDVHTTPEVIKSFIRTGIRKTNNSSSSSPEKPVEDLQS